MIYRNFARSTNGTEPGSPPRNHQEWKNAKAKQPKILIVEDELLVAENIKEILQLKGYKAIEVLSSAEETVENFRAVGPDLIIMDVHLGGTLDGIHAAIQIHETLKKVPILFLTAYSRADFPHLIDIDPAFYSYLSKPYDPNEFLRILEKLLAKCPFP
ncbi:response regulator [bacterium]|nr:response regulator [bacterium]